MNHLMASAPWFLPRSIGIWTHQRPEFGLSSVITARFCWSHFFMSPDSKLSEKRTSGSFAMPASPLYFAAIPEEDASDLEEAGCSCARRSSDLRSIQVAG